MTRPWPPPGCCWCAAREEAGRHLAQDQLPDDSVDGAGLLGQLQEAVAALAADAAARAAAGAKELARLRTEAAALDRRIADHAELGTLEELEDKHRTNEPAYRQLAEDLQAHRRAELLAAPIRHRDLAAAAAGQAAGTAQQLAEAAAAHPLYGDYGTELPALAAAGEAAEQLGGPGGGRGPGRDAAGPGAGAAAGGRTAAGP